MNDFESTKLWQRGFVTYPGFQSERNRLKNAFFQIRKRATELAKEIGKDVPTLTNHDIEHIDALWSTADTIIGDGLLDASEPLLNPTETFVLGCSFLIHDLAHSRAALGMSDPEIKSDPLYLDIAADVRNSKRAKTSKSHEEEKEILARFLRATHAASAEKLPQRFWLDDEGRQQFLIEDSDLRDSLGESIGRVAASHHWDTDRLNEVFSTIGGPVSLPRQWKLDLLKLACIIRLADVAQIDSRRAPTFLKLFRRPTGFAKSHWDFQQKINQPIAEGDRLVFSSGSSFSLDLAEAWWTGYDLLRFVEKELGAVDALLADTGRPRFAVRTVAGIQDPTRLAKLIPTIGWNPIDTRIRVGNVANLVSRLGGEQLYGDNSLAPLRELIQNASDAIRARRLIEGHDQSWGAVNVRLRNVNGEHWLSVSDNGVGMSETVLVGALLDFGASFWKSDLAANEYPRLKGMGFEPTGRYGIGFFSTFMLGDRVKVISRRYDLGASDTKVLEFSKGTHVRPILRQAVGDERNVCGTKVEIRLRVPPRDFGGLLQSASHTVLRGDLNSICAWLCPTSEVTITTQEGEKDPRSAVTGGDWRSMKPLDLLSRVEKMHHSPHMDSAELNRRHSDYIRPLFDKDGLVIGRACIRLESEDGISVFHDTGVITVGGARAESLQAIAGVFAGESDRASRDSAHVIAKPAELKRWAAEQLGLIETSSVSPEIKNFAAGVLRGSGLPTGRLPIAESRVGWLDSAALVELGRKHSTVVLTTHLHMKFGASVDQAHLEENVLLFLHGSQGLALFEQEPQRSRKWPSHDYYAMRMEGVAVEALATAWSCDQASILKNADHSSDHERYSAKVGVDQYGNPVVQDFVTILYRPGAPRGLPACYLKEKK